MSLEQIHTARLLLRKPVPQDAAGIFRAYTQDPAVCRYMVWRPHTAEEQAHIFIARCIAEWNVTERLPYIICLTGSTQPVGMLEARMHGATADIGYLLARAHWGLGYMPEAVAAFTNQALAGTQFRVQASCDVENRASQRTLEKAGFVREARLERYTVHPNLSDEPRACYLFARWR
jgi:[ribosomal protein S5]-alanine N-acetyltransferase